MDGLCGGAVLGCLHVGDVGSVVMQGVRFLVDRVELVVLGYLRHVKL